MDLKQLRTFVAIVEHGSVSKAAIYLHTAQPALSRQLADLESALGLALFDRVGRRLLLTGEGEQLLGDCRNLLGQARSLSEQAQVLRGGDSGLLKVAAFPVQIESVLATLLPGYARQFPNVHVKLVESIGANTLAMLHRGDIHLGITLRDILKPSDDSLEVYSLPPHELMCVCQPAFPLPKTRSIDIAHIVSHPLLLLDASFAARKKFDATCRLADLKPNILIECRTPHTLLALAEAGLGTAVIPSGVRMDRYAVRALRITHKGKPLLDPLAIVWEGRRKLPRYAKKFCELVAAHMRLPRELSFTGVPQVKQRVRVV